MLILALDVRETSINNKYNGFHGQAPDGENFRLLPVFAWKLSSFEERENLHLCVDVPGKNQVFRQIS